MNKTPENSCHLNHFQIPAAEHNLYITNPPYRFHRRERDTLTAIATIEFTEMLCQLDFRLDQILPPCWFKHGYLFALMDALRTQYVNAYGVHTKRVSSKNGLSLVTEFPNPSSWPADFWVKENMYIDIIKQYLTAHPAAGDADNHDQPASLSVQPLERRKLEHEAGLSPTNYYPFATSELAIDDPYRPEETDENSDLYEGIRGIQLTLPLSQPDEMDDLPNHPTDGPSNSGSTVNDSSIDWDGEGDDTSDLL